MNRNKNNLLSKYSGILLEIWSFILFFFISLIIVSYGCKTTRKDQTNEKNTKPAKIDSTKKSVVPKLDGNPAKVEQVRPLYGTKFIINH